MAQIRQRDGPRLFDNIILPGSADFHVHLRQSSLMHTVVSTPHAGGVDTVYVMPNLNPPIDTVAAALAYKEELEKAAAAAAAGNDANTANAANTKFLMTLYLNDKITPEVIREAKASGAIAGVKSYPRGVTTGSDGGVKGVDYSPYYPVFAAMQDAGLVLNLHGECPFADPDDDDDDDDELEADDGNAVIDVLNAEERFLPTLREVVTRFPRLKVVLEHVTTRAAVEYVRALRRDGFANVAATITAHHLWLTVDDWAGDGLNFCKPVAKREADRRALIRAGVQGEGVFFLGSDSAPHLLSSKKGSGHGGLDKCSAGVFTQPIVTQLVLEAWEQAVRKGVVKEEDVKRPGVLEGFLGVWGRTFYGLEESKRRIRVKAGGETVKDILRVDGVDSNDGVVPFWTGKKIYSLEWIE